MTAGRAWRWQRSHLRRLACFSGLGVASAIVSLGCYTVLRGALDAQTANLGATVMVGLVNGVANQQLTFGVTGRGSIRRHLMPSLALLGLGLLLTAAALHVLTVEDPAPSRIVEVAVVVGSGALAGLVRFGVLSRLRGGGPGLRIWARADDPRLAVHKGLSSSAGGLTDQVVLLGDVRRATGGLRVGRGGGGEVAAELVQVAADGMPSVAVAEHVAQPVGLAQPGGGAEDVADRDRAPEHGGGFLAHRIVGEGDEVVVPRQDLRPVGLLGARRIVVQGGDGGLDLVPARALGGQR
jgi:putative flippase GtrA